MANGINNKLQGLLGGGNALFDVGVGLLASSAPRPVGTATFGSRLAEATQFASQRAQAGMQTDAMRQHLADQQRRRQFGSEVEAFINAYSQPGEIAADGGVGPPQTTPAMLSPEQAQWLRLMGQHDPNAALSALGQKIGFLGGDESARIGASPLGKYFADLEIAEQQGNTSAVSALRAAIEQEIGGDEAGVSFDDVRSIRNDVIRNSGSFLEQQRGYQSVVTAAEDPSPAGDLALLFGTMKILDPGSIVREGEVQLTEGAGSLAQRVAGQIKRTFQGERLTDGQRQDFLRMSRNQYEIAERQHNRLIDDARGFADRHGFAFEDVVPEYLMPDSGQGGGVTEYDYDPTTGQLVPRR